jgi:hypothetical protein
MPEISGSLEGVETIKGSMNVRDLKVVVGGIVFYKRIWDQDKRTTRKFRIKNIIDLLKLDETFDKEGFFKEVEDKKGKTVEVQYRDMKTSFVYWVLDRLHGVYIPKKYREIELIR